MELKKLVLQGFAVYGIAVAATKLSKSYLDENGKAIATGIAAKVIDFIFDEYEPKTHDKKPLSFETRREANEVIGELKAIINDYGYATVADIYDLVGVNPSYKDNVYGWKDLDKAKVKRKKVKDYRVVLPKPHKVA